MTAGEPGGRVTAGESGDGVTAGWEVGTGDVSLSAAQLGPASSS